MVREVDLVSYIPMFIAEYKETNATLRAENPEFRAAWKAADRVLYNEFIATADEYGISRFEKLMQILPYDGDTLETRRLRVQSRWFSMLPYTWRMLLQKLTILCGGDFEVSVPELGEYELHISVVLGPRTRTLLVDVLQMLEGFLPTNLYYQVTGIGECIQTGIYVGAAVEGISKPGQVIDGYQVNRITKNMLSIGISTEGIYHPESMIDGYCITRSIKHNIYHEFPINSIYRNVAR